MRKLKIGPYTYTIEYVSNPNHDGNEVWGYHNPLTQTIVIDKDASDDRQAAILMHEIMHACWDIGLDNRKECSEEDVCTQLAPLISMVLKDNPDLRKKYGK